ncbi:helix-turn-helix domain-containing protein [Mitsuokella multacida]|uniref:XRE family transcriptional regulator n=1 Tax=Mitsuokella multacida TaxID=52226 RepID=A0A414NZX1_9FIRM|nr:helix-turn-helix transcriptional regulator [Mitsuokella multacida]RHF53457.1 XRE family transcriptional regulator [Mitsuokella multacida]
MNRIKELRAAKNLTQEKLGEILNVQKAAISKYENGRADPSVDILKRMACYFNVSSDYLLELSDTARPPVAPSSTLALSAHEQDLLHKYHTLTDEHKGLLNTQLDAMYNLDKPKAEDAAT